MNASDTRGGHAQEAARFLSNPEKRRGYKVTSAHARILAVFVEEELREVVYACAQEEEHRRRNGVPCPAVIEDTRRRLLRLRDVLAPLSGADTLATGADR